MFEQEKGWWCCMSCGLEGRPQYCSIDLGIDNSLFALTRPPKK